MEKCEGFLWILNIYLEGNDNFRYKIMKFKPIVYGKKVFLNIYNKMSHFTIKACSKKTIILKMNEFLVVSFNK